MGMHITGSIKILMKQICRQVCTKDNENVIPAVIKRESRNKKHGCPIIATGDSPRRKNFGHDEIGVF
ncbi:MAG: hypothetical protein Q8M71_03225 [Thermodesulfovibrionales bacterium]|nr:hypothetical protein [Thermodesulfovibrionales bacterium]